MTKLDNDMRNIKLEKLVINCCIGESGDKLKKAARVLEQLTGQTPTFSKAKITIRNWGIRRNEEIACKVTVRGIKAEELLERALKVKDFMINEKSFSTTGNFGFGIEEHIDLGIKYDPLVGIFGMDFYCVLCRNGHRIKYKKRSRSCIGKKQRIKKSDSIIWFNNKFLPNQDKFE
ncbi:60S ribosomal protein L11B (nucleomorph) [Guillardia theta]|uniref:60S ribosomal protein L11B n=1 Tax=Guillardia theta TaxID=55529 RepID=Q98RR5_GUITH|nr:60S ribosomal protein L11B [Guillardia theta]AAK39882.1 60S ribosomal protein L11B [Guillardia theta]|mmetsp:Transcript_46196/g.144869  ORF Transcript_46196/g.144869 Transcript_46196/m.144869 type:complete len:175 (-) Transcript_46196:3006-3530(-)